MKKSQLHLIEEMGQLGKNGIGILQDSSTSSFNA